MTASACVAFELLQSGWCIHIFIYTIFYDLHFQCNDEVYLPNSYYIKCILDFLAQG